MKDAGVQFHKGIPTTFHLQKWFWKGDLLRLNDLMERAVDEELLGTKHSHHLTYHRVVLVPGHVSTREICKEYFQERPLLAKHLTCYSMRSTLYDAPSKLYQSMLYVLRLTH